MEQSRKEKRNVASVDQKNTHWTIKRSDLGTKTIETFRLTAFSLRN